jgi:iron complex outermembrane receptor protein
MRHSWALTYLVCFVLSGAPALAQSPPPPAAAGGQTTTPPCPATKLPPGDPGQSKACPEPQEVGGRLVVRGDTVVVSGNPDLPIRDSSVATKTDTPLQETPRSISITGRQTLDDRLATNIADAHDYTTGLMPADDRGPAFARGFRIGFYDVRRDGLRTYAWSIREPAGIERVQYLRGAAAILYGDGSPGGLVNLVLKKPLPLRVAEFAVSGGGLGFGRVTGDVTGPITADGRWRYRLVGAAEWLGNGIDNGERRLSLLPMLSVDLSDAVTLNVDGELYQQRGRNYWHFVPSTPDTQHGDFSKIPWDLNTASPDDGWSGWNASPGVRLDARLNERSSLYVSGRYTRIGGDIDIQGLAGLAADGRTLNRYAYREISTWNEYQSDGFVTTAFDTGPLAHRLVAGIEAGLSTTDSEIGIGGAPPLDMHDPVYGPKPAEPALLPTRYDVSRFGAYVQDQIRVGAFRIVPGLRWSRLGVHDKVNGAAGGASEPGAVSYAVSPSIGVVVLPGAGLSFYGTAARGFEPPTPGQYLENRRTVEPARNQLLEGGARAELLGGRLAAAGAVFRIVRTNVPESDARGFYRQIGEGRSWGVETEVAGSVWRGLGIQGGYAWTRTEVTEDLAGFVGRELPNAPRHNVSLWMRYRFSESALAGLMVAAGVLHVSDRFTSASNLTVVPAYTRLDLSGTYPLSSSRLELGVAVQNATNVRYVTSGAGAVLYAGPPRRVVVRLSSRF